jgi:hypothetical protein
VIAVLILGYLTGCVVSTPLVTETPLHTPLSPSSTVPPSPTLELATHTPTVNPATPTVAPSPTPQVFPSPTFTPYPTLTVDEKHIFVKEMLETNGGCELPCWWGIMPGDTTWQVAHNFFISRGISWFYEDELNFDPPPSEYLIQYNLDLYFEREAEKVHSIQVLSQVLGDPKINHFAQDWSYFSWSQVMMRHGKPSLVAIHFAPPIEAGSPVYYNLALVYDQSGFRVNYQGPAVYNETTIRACPRFDEVSFIVLTLQEPPMEESDLGSSRRLEDAVGMDVMTFYETFKHADSNACLESASDMWP